VTQGSSVRSGLANLATAGLRYRTRFGVQLWTLDYGLWTAYHIAMSRRKRLLLILGVLIAAAIGFIVRAGRGPSKPSLSVTFIGYTNLMITRTNGSNTNFSTFARLRITNSGPVTIRLLGLYIYLRSENKNLYSAPSDIPGALTSLTFPQTLKPGACLSYEPYIPPECTTWEAMTGYQQWGLWDRSYDWLSITANSGLSDWLNRHDSRPPGRIIMLGPMTNQLPAAYAKPVDP